MLSKEKVLCDRIRLEVPSWEREFDNRVLFGPREKYDNGWKTSIPTESRKQMFLVVLNGYLGNLIKIVVDSPLWPITKSRLVSFSKSYVVCSSNDKQ